ncbi:phospholipid phosphatase 2-like [Hemiscyllium ocellatum]|uniref:phospholipid phosphatase 2-like n=1 Tax=Hemiscyllium ocellatum TaxID=170820 RepID=UPI0029670FC5|nr:phospholipid phosphatase 2-like [Hemiscyllium ocellatum]XP_060702277.1 phospholipid phosphatase 2-like [Hemiscyllium ocellatum]XP_060702278.1 phospholipid phosphatase 2-like [Hemiscyllium ocellatum]XP_060702279.1 phospholipid phosphatase 2-like [Hemiscyllium ocellatum]XP_060702281.1 phospholipid phosphatase 2-like [Hemiscyllium ocellatum]
MFEKRIVLILVDVLCVIVALLPFIILTLKAKPNMQGFYCDDDSIKYPYKKDTISHWLMAAIIIPVSIVIVGVGEAFMVHLKLLYSRSEFNNYLAALYKVVGTFVFGASLSLSLTYIAKYTVGRLRPNFLALCKLNMSSVNCSQYVQSYSCTGPVADVTEARLSFYSGHSSFGMYCVVFISLYLQVRLHVKWARLLRPTIQFFLLTFAIYVGYTRISDYRHHWSDVLVGFLQGAIVAILIVRYVSDFYKDRPLSNEVFEASGPERKPNIPLTETEPMNHYGTRHIP